MSNSGSLELRRRGYENFEGKSYWLVVGLILVTTLFIAIIIVIPTENKLLTKIADAFSGEDNFLPISNLIFSWLAVLAVRIDFQSRLILDDTGIIYKSGIPKIFQFIRFDWQYRWSEITGVTFRKESLVSPLLSSVGLAVNGKIVRVIPWRWVDPNDPQDKKATKGSFLMSQSNLHKKVEETAVIKFLKRHGILDLGNPLKDPIDTLNKNRTAWVFAGLFTVFILYTLTDLILVLTEHYFPATPWIVFTIAACLGIYGSYKLLLKEKLPKNECAAIAMLFGLGVGTVSYPLSIRIAMWTDDQGPLPYSYELASDGKWLPADHRAPILEFDRRDRYWAHFDVGDKRTFEVRRGIFGYTLIDMKDINDEQRKFYRGNKATHG